MNDTVDELGPVDYLVVEFPADKANFSGEMASDLTALVDRGVVRVLDLVLLRKELDGSVEGFESHDFGDIDLGGLRELETDLALLLAEEDVESIGAALEPGSVAVAGTAAVAARGVARREDRREDRRDDRGDRRDDRRDRR